jgi:hypothetical protein
MSHPLLKSLIESMIGNYLEESYGDDLVESIFEEVSDETWEAIEEAILNELSPDTLKSYWEKAHGHAKKLTRSMASAHDREYSAELRGKPKTAEKIFQKAGEDGAKRTKRFAGMDAADKKYKEKTGKSVLSDPKIWKKVQKGM